MTAFPPTMRPGENPPGQTPGRCDFCTVREANLPGSIDFPQPESFTVVRGDPTLLLPGLLAIDLTPLTFEAGEWHACPVCAPVVSTRNPERLAAHVTTQQQHATSDPADLAHHAGLVSLYRAVLPRLGLAHAAEGCDR